ncbi:MAG: FTR1 family protein [Burkholderiaceae bacterium]|nr:FTR1 family protein [Burkholderiaceae bacterium]
MQNFGQILFVMWRETVEAMLVVGILHAWLSHNPSGKCGIVYLWSGVAAGLAGAFLLGLGIEATNSVLSDDGQEYFRAGMLLVAAGLIVQMVFWMRRHGRRLKQDMEQSLSHSALDQRWWGVFSLAAIAVAREGSETVVFLSSLAMGSNGLASGQFWLALGLGVILAGGTFFMLQLGGKLISWRAFFRVTEVLLLLLGCALLVSGVEKLIDVQALPALKAQVWDSSVLLDDGTILGGVVSAFTGYRTRPALMTLIVFSGYWLAIRWWMRPAKQLART